RRRELLVDRRRRWLLAACILYITAGICYRLQFQRKTVLIPYLDWLLLPGKLSSPLFPSSDKVRLAITLLAYGFAIILGWLLASRYLLSPRSRLISQPEWFIVVCGVFAFGLQLIFVWFCDVYLIGFVPFAAFALCQMSGKWSRWSKALTAVLCLLALGVSSLW